MQIFPNVLNGLGSHCGKIYSWLLFECGSLCDIGGIWCERIIYYVILIVMMAIVVLFFAQSVRSIVDVRFLVV